MQKTVSVIIPCYNGENVIDRSIESVYIQECDYIIELVVVDDGSTDESKRRIHSWKSSFKSKGYILKYVYQENLGLGGAINTGLKYVTGEYLTLLDADDCFLEGSIKKRADFLEANPDYVGVRTNGWQDKHGERKLFVTNSEEKKRRKRYGRQSWRKPRSKAVSAGRPLTTTAIMLCDEGRRGGVRWV